LRKQDFSPSVIDLGNVQFILARHFGFCYGVENAIEISYKALEENPDKRVFLLSQMIHNPEVNADLQDRGIAFIMDTDGKQLIPWTEIQPNDVVIIPAFGTTLEIENLLLDKGVEIQQYNTTCPFVEKVWNRAEKLGKDNHTVIIHGKPTHEETRATFSHANAHAKSVVIRNMEEAKQLAAYIRKEKDQQSFEHEFANRFSKNFSVDADLVKIGVVNQTTMLASETQAIADYLKKTMEQFYGTDSLKNHFADTRDTLCYATNDNQDATHALLQTDADVALVIGGYNSSNTSHLVELLEQKFSTYFINGEKEIVSAQEINHYDYPAKTKRNTKHFLPAKDKLKIIITSGASCPDTVVDRVIIKLANLSNAQLQVQNAVAEQYQA
jgi:4-hydroxy-3-methylbut-2-enyl diphosphate reductase